MLFFQLDDFTMAFFSAVLKSEELAASNHCLTPARGLCERLKKIIFLSLLLRDSWKSVLTGKGNLSVNNESVFLTRQLKCEWHNRGRSGLPRLLGRLAHPPGA